MIIYQSMKSEFMDDVYNDAIAELIRERLINALGHNIGIAEFNSWNNSMRFMSMVLTQTLIPDDCGICIEYKIPNSSKRVDFIVTGKNDDDKLAAVIVELKQWQKAEPFYEAEDLVLTYLQGRERTTTHPSYQAWSYASTIKDYNENVQKMDIDIYPCAYLHNYQKKANDPIESEFYQPYVDYAPIFMKGDAQKLSEFIERFITKGDNGQTIYLIDQGKIRPSKSLQDNLSSMLNGNPEFFMIDEQKEVYEKAKILARRSKADHKKRVFIVDGGPGTGKSVLAIKLLVQFINEDIVSKYVTKNAAPRNVYRAHLKKNGKKDVDIKHLFAGSGEFTDCESNIFGALIVDEAHRLNEKSGMFHNLGENQIKELINASEFSIFFIDQYQKIHIDDIGTIDEIVKWAKHFNADIKHAVLSSQFRCNGSDGYLAWVDNTLQIRETANEILDVEYDFRVVDSAEELRNIIIEKNRISNKARILAGYCWEWISEGKNDAGINDINIGEFHMSWNLANSVWAIDTNSVDQVGCIHTSQGLEFDYVGIIIGLDMIYRDGKIITNFLNRAKTDKSLFGIKQMYKNNSGKAEKIANEIIKNTYRTLMTRGQKGCFVYCLDKELSDHFSRNLTILE